MPLSAPDQSSSNSSNFAGLLASLTSPAPNAADSDLPWNDVGLDHDVATLSYERALRTHARCKPAASGNWPDSFSLHSPIGDVAQTTKTRPATVCEEIKPQASAEPHTSSESSLRTASVTIRLSEAECARLRRRAAEAGLTISAYLRSCTFEVETLRAQVKETLAELRATGAEQKTPACSRSRCSWFGWLMRLAKRRQ